MENTLYISKSNSIIFVKGKTNRYLNDENTFSCEEEKDTTYKAVQCFEDIDSPTTQIKSNSEKITVNVIENNFIIDTIFPVRKSENLNKKITLDCDVVNSTIEDNKVIIFRQGFVLDNDTLEVKSGYYYNGNLPEWIQTNDLFLNKSVSVNGEELVVIGVEYSEQQEAFGLLVGSSISEGTYIFSANYNLSNTDVYEFQTPFREYKGKKITIEVIAENKNLPLATYKSECIEIIEQERTLEIVYKGDEDRDIVYSTGIYHLLRLSSENIEPYTNEDFNNETTDDSAFLTESQIHEGNIFKVVGLTQAMYRKLVIAVSHKQVFINGQKYIKDGAVEKEVLGSSNLIDCNFKMLKAGDTINEDLHTITHKNYNIKLIDNTSGGFIGYDDVFLGY